MPVRPVNNNPIRYQPANPPMQKPGPTLGQALILVAVCPILGFGMLAGCTFAVPDRPRQEDGGVGDAPTDTNNNGDTLPDTIQGDVIQSDAIVPDAQNDAIQNDSGGDGQVCSPATPYTDNTFSNPIAPINVAITPGNLTLAEDYSTWTNKYEGDVIPTAAGWTDFDPLAWTAPTPEIQSGTILHLNSVDSDRNGYYSKNTAFSNAGGWIAETRMKVGDNTQSTPSADGCAIEVNDGVKKFELRFLNTRILDFTSGQNYTIDTRADYHIYRMVGRNDNIFVYVDGVLRINGVNALTGASASNLIRFHDLTTTADSDALWDYIYSYNGGTALPYKPSGSAVFGPLDTGTTSNNIGSGATISWVDNLPAGTSVTMELFASNSSTLPGTPCASGLSTSGGEVIPASCSGQNLWWKTDLYASALRDAAPTVSSITIDYETCN